MDLCNGRDQSCIAYQIRHTNIAGIRIKKLRKDLFEMKSDTILDDFVIACVAHESVEPSSEDLGQVDAETTFRC